MNSLSRRRFIQILGASSACLISDLANSESLRNDPLHQNRLNSLSLKNATTLKSFSWNHTAMGTDCSILLALEDQRFAEMLANKCKKEISRLEQIFSLHLPGSTIRALNDSGCLRNPPPEFLELIEFAEILSEVSDGIFDITIQPLFKYFYYLTTLPDSSKVASLTQLIDYKSIVANESEITFLKPKMQITLNGIAQGFITDKITDLLKAHGIKNVLVNIGEFFALGVNNRPQTSLRESHPLPPHLSQSHYKKWSVGISNHKNQIEKVVDLENLAIATSAAYGTQFGLNNSMNHLINAKTLTCSDLNSSLSVISKSATLSDGLSTTLALTSKTGNSEITSTKRSTPHENILKKLRSHPKLKYSIDEIQLLNTKA
jgi:FAD:protein FMN transferase